MNDEELARESSRGNDDALGVLYGRYAASIFGIARRVIGEISEAEDTVQQVFIELHRAADRMGEAPGSVRCWLHARVFQRALTKREHLESIGFYKSAEVGQLESELEAGAATRFQLFPPELSRLIDELFHSVSPRQRLAIRLHVYEGLTMEQIAARNSQTVAVVRHNFYNGLRKMRAALEGHDELRRTAGVDREH